MLVLATKNRGKAREYLAMFSHKNIQVKTLADFGNRPQAKETGDSFEANAMLKAKAAVNWLNVPVLTDDSGLKVRALNGRPGIYSARYAGNHDDLANRRKLLKELKGVDHRQAQFVTCLCLLKPNGRKLVVYGKLRGEILRAPRGHNGFGYDPLFYVPKYQKTLAQMSTQQKNRISHRGVAARKMIRYFDAWWLKN